MTKLKKSEEDSTATEKHADRLEFRKRHPKKSYMVDDEDENLDLDPIDEDDEDPLDKDPDEKEILSPKAIDPFTEEDEEEDF